MGGEEAIILLGGDRSFWEPHKLAGIARGSSTQPLGVNLTRYSYWGVRGETRRKVPYRKGKGSEVSSFVLTAIRY